MKKYKSLSIIDNAFLVVETKDSPNHVASLLVFRKPKKAKKDYIRQVYSFWLQNDNAFPPFNLKLKATNPLSPYWFEDDNFNIRHHLSLLELPENSSRETVDEAVSQLHEPLTDRNKPLWSCVLIDGMADNEFAIYVRIHHALIDGISGGRIMGHALSASRPAKGYPPFWAIENNPYNTRKNRLRPSLQKKFVGLMNGNIKTIYGLSRISTQLFLEKVGLTKNAISLPFSASKSILTGPIEKDRRFTRAFLPMKRIDHLRKVTRNTLNHIALACLDAAIHRYLKDIGSPIDSPITINMPVSLRKEDAKVGGNLVGMVAAKLSPKTDDPVLRLREIGISLQGIRNQVDLSPASSIQAYSLITAFFSFLTEVTGTTEVMPIQAHTVVSNVPGPSQPLYLEGSKLIEWYPISTLGPGQRMNVTMFSYADNLYFGIVATKSYLPKLNLLSKYITEAFEELEKVVTSPDKGVSMLEKLRSSMHGK